MGITVHWEGSTESEEAVKRVIQYVEFFAKSLGWEVKRFTEEGYAGMETAEEVYEFPDFYTKEQARDFNIKSEDMEESVKEGVIINPTKPFYTETIEISFFKFKGKYWMKDFCKTQVFGREEMANLVAHQLLVSLLEAIKETWMPNLKISDEGGFYKTYNFETLAERHRSNLTLINQCIRYLTGK